MADANLLNSWKVTEGLLERARQVLPEPFEKHRPDYDALLSEYREYLDHNELELGLETLEVLGQLLACGSGFWRDLEKAAENMSLTEKALSRRTRVSDSPPPADPT